MGDGEFGRPAAALDVEAFGAVGDGVTDNSAAFERAAAAAGAAGLVVPEGVFRLGRDVVLDTPVRFFGRVKQEPAYRLVLRRNLDLSSYQAAFGAAQALPRALAALFAAAGSAELDLAGRTVPLRKPLDLARYARSRQVSGRKTIRNGTFTALPGPAWEAGHLRSHGRFDPSRSTELRGVREIDRIPPGASITGPGLGRGLHVGGVDRRTETVRLSLPGWGDADFARYGFRRIGYAFDFSALERLGDLCFEDIRLELRHLAGGILLPARHGRVRATRLVVIAPAGAGLSGIGRGAGELDLDQCRFEAAAPEGAVGVMNPSGRLRLRGCAFEGFSVAAILAGRGNLVSGCRFSGGGGRRCTALLLTRRDTRLQVVGSAFDECGIDWTDEHEARFDAGRKAGFGSLALLGNAFDASDVAAHQAWLTVRAHRRAQPIRDLTVIGNSFTASGGRAERAEAIAETGAGLDLSRMRNIAWHGNSFRGIDQPASNPVTREFALKIPQRVWTLEPHPLLPFAAAPAGVVSVVGVDLRNASGQAVQESPVAQIDTATGRIQLRFSLPVSGTVRLTLRCDDAG